MSYFVYILYSESFDKYYIGQTNDISIRLERYNKGMEKYTKPYLPWILKGIVEKETRSEAMILEKKLKNISKNRLQSFLYKYSKGSDES